MKTKTRKNMIEERCVAIKRTQQNFMRMIEERGLKMKQSQAPFLTNDLMFKIFLLMPIKTLMKFKCVCKSWKMIINCAQFVEAYNNKPLTKTSAILLRPIESDRLLDKSFNIEIEVSKLESLSIFPFDTWERRRAKVINFLEIEDGKGKFVDLNICCLGSIVAVCNGLVLISSTFKSPRMTNNNAYEVPTSNKRRLIIMNPMSRKVLGLPLGTNASDPYLSESYGLVFSHLEGVYKVVHLFKDELGHIGCEVWSTDTRYWRTIDGPSGTISQFTQIPPIWANGALHWVPSRSSYYNPIDYIVSMRSDNERFFVINLPMGLGQTDKLVEIGGVLSYVHNLDMNNIEVWMLYGFESTDWIKQHTIQIDDEVGDAYSDNYMPFFVVNDKEVIFQRRTKLYSYDFAAEEMTEIEMEGRRVREYETLIPFTNNLATWERLEPML